MKDKASGTYIINEAYEILSYNDVAKEMYPQLFRGEKCYKLLMGRDTPCDVCPVLHHVMGPQTYLDPIRNIYETVDAVPMYMPDGTNAYALVLSTSGERERLARQLPATEKELEALINQEYYDRLTGLYNRKGFIRELEKRLLTEQEELAVLYLDLKNFKALNDLYGSAGGDMLLRQLSMELQQSTLAPLVAARLEADHFVLLVQRKNLSAAGLTRMLMEEWTYDGHGMRVLGLCGIYYIEDRSVPAAGMIDLALLARNSISETTLKPYAVFDPVMRINYIGQAELLAEFQTALSNGEFQVYYQPIVNAGTGAVMAVEALSRWISPKWGLVSPAVYVPVLEKNSLISRLDLYVLQTVYRMLTTRIAEGLHVFPVSVNLSWQDFYDEELTREVLAALSNPLLTQGYLRFELTETSVAAIEQNTSGLLETLRAKGSKILLDDFGTGYSSFGMIRKYDFDILKMDMSFVRRIAESEKTRNIIRSIIEMGHNLGLHIVAEGVETEEQAQFLRESGCDALQGYLFARPLTPAEFDIYIQKQPENAGNQQGEEDASRLAVDESFLKQVLNGTAQFIQVCDTADFTMVYANQATVALSPYSHESFRGRKCYEYMLGSKKQCDHCPLRMMNGETEKSIEVDDGNYVFSLTARIMEYKGRRLFVEYGMDITNQKRALKRYDSQISAILASIPEEQGIFHVDVTADEWISSGGNAQNARDMQEMPNVDARIRRIAGFVPDEAGREVFFDTFYRSELLAAWNRGQHRIELETLFYYDDLSIRWTRVTANLVSNPENRHVECVLHGVDISKEKGLPISGIQRRVVCLEEMR